MSAADDPVDRGLSAELAPWLDDLRSLSEPVPELDLVLARAALAGRDLDAELVALWDSREHAGVLQRGGDDDWQLSLAAGEVDVVVTVVPGGGRCRLVGAVTGPDLEAPGSDPVVLHVEDVSGRTQVRLDDLGRFEHDAAAGPLRLHCSVAGAAYVSGWVTA